MSEPYTEAIENDTYSMCTSQPVMQCPPFVWLKPNESIDPDRTGIASVQPGSVDCLEPILTYSDEVETINSCHEVITRTWLAEDPQDPSLYTTCVQTIKRIDEENPIIENSFEDITMYTNNAACEQPVTWEEPNIYDNYAVDFIVITGIRNGTIFPVFNGFPFEEGITEVSYAVYDFCGNVSEATFTVNIMCASCSIECPSNVCLPVGSDVSPDSIGFAVANSDNVNCGMMSLDYQDMVLETGCDGAGTSLRIWSAVFETMSHMEFTCAQTIEIKDDSELVIYGCPEDINVQNAYTRVHWEDPVALNGSYITYLTSSYNSGSYFPLGVTNVVYTATDQCGNETTCSFNVNVLNDDSYTDCPDDIVTSCDGDGTTTVTWEVPEYEGDCMECPKGKTIPGFIYVGSLDGSNYYCSRHYYNYEQAKATAAKFGGYLASINSREENEYLSAHIGSATALIGLSDIENEGHFVWESGEELTFQDWFTAQPNNANYNQDVVELMRSGEWNDIEASAKREFVMEIPCEYVTQIEGPSSGEDLDPGEHYVLYKIADGCGLEKYCGFNITVTSGITMTCHESIVVEIPYEEDVAIVEWDALEYSSCCADCNDASDCIDLTLIEGMPSGSAFERDSLTGIRYRAEDSCGNIAECYFEVQVNTRPGGRVHVIDDEEYTNLEVTSIELMDEEEEISETGKELETFNELTNGSKNIEGLVKEDDSRMSHQFLIYPNPARQNATVEVQDYEDLISITIVSQDGKFVFEKYSGFSFKENIRMINWSYGFYSVILRYSDGSLHTMRLIKS